LLLSANIPTSMHVTTVFVEAKVSPPPESHTISRYLY
jgi:hypothetical protein